MYIYYMYYVLIDILVKTRNGKENTLKEKRGGKKERVREM